MDKQHQSWHQRGAGVEAESVLVAEKQLEFINLKNNQIPPDSMSLYRSLLSDYKVTHCRICHFVISSHVTVSWTMLFGTKEVYLTVSCLGSQKGQEMKKEATLSSESDGGDVSGMRQWAFFHSVCLASRPRVNGTGPIKSPHTAVYPVV